MYNSTSKKEKLEINITGFMSESRARKTHRAPSTSVKPMELLEKKRRERGGRKSVGGRAPTSEKRNHARTAR